MSSILKIKAFKGLADGPDDPEEYLDDVQGAAEVWRIQQPSNQELYKRQLSGSLDRTSWTDMTLPTWWWQMAAPP